MKNWKKAVSLTAAAAMVMATMAPVSVFAEDETFKIGVIGPMTGDYAQYGTNVYNATKIAVDEINANGGFNGYQVEVLDAGDDQGDPEKAVNAYNDLLDKGMQMLCGTVTSGSCIAVGAEAGYILLPAYRHYHVCAVFLPVTDAAHGLESGTQIRQGWYDG